MTAPQNDPWGFRKAPKWQRVFIIIIFSLGVPIGGVALIASLYDASSNAPTMSTPSTVKPQTAEEATNAQMLGIWTYTEPIDRSVGDVFPFTWVKWEIRADGTMTSYYADPRDDNWGEGEVKPYKFVSDKYSDTGVRWYGIREGNTAVTGIYRDGKITLHLAGNKTKGAMTKGDKTPFSK